MTRFARAKGSKSSNEKKPEEATSWSEMKNAMLTKKSSKPDKLIPQDEPVKTDAPKNTEWASLGNDTMDESVLLLKQHSGKKDESMQELKKGKKKKKVLDHLENKVNSSVTNRPKNGKKCKKQKNSDVDSEISVRKKEGKRRKLTEGDGGYDSVLPKKQKKFLENGNVDAGLEEESEQNVENAGNRVEKKNKNMKKERKSKNIKKQNEVNRRFEQKMGRQSQGGKKLKNKNFKERNSEVEDLIINGEKIKITKFQGFYITLDDAERLKKLRSEMIKEGIPKVKLEAAIKLERRRAEKALSRLKKSVCFHCRGHGHLLSNCPSLLEKENTGTGICYKCGSTEHSAAMCKVIRGTNYQFAECFICKEQGHIARQCPDNPRGLYPQGGACRECGDVTHLRKDCPKVQAQKAEEVVTVGLRGDRDLECLDEEIASREKQSSKKKVKKNPTVKF